MLQVAMSGGEVRVVEVPEPVVRPGTVRVRTSHSLISAGTEGASIGSGGRRENLVLKAIRNPALVMKVVDRVASHGLKSTAELVKTRVSTEMPSGYSCAGIVTDVGEGVVDIHVGDRVACAGAGYANHAAVNVVPRNLVAPIPDAVSFEEAAFVTLGAIALHATSRPGPVGTPVLFVNGDDVSVPEILEPILGELEQDANTLSPQAYSSPCAELSAGRSTCT